MLHYFCCINKIEKHRYSSLAWISGWAGSGGSFLFPHQQRKLLYLFFSRRMEKLPALTLHRSCAGYAGTSGLSGEFWFFSAGLLGWLLGLGVLFSVPAQWTHTNIPGAAEEPLLLFPVGFGWGCPQGLLCHMAEASDILGESVTPTAVTCAGISSCPSGSEKSQFQPEKVSLPISKIGLQGPTQTFQPKPTLGVCDSMKFGFLHFFSGVF